MFWFLRLFLAHLIADFPLQTNKIFEYKKSTPYGVLIHTGIYLTVSLFLSFPYLKYKEALLFLFFIFILHTIIDLNKVKKLSLKDGIKEFLVDQLKHLLVLCTVFTLPISKKVLYLELPSNLKFIERFYNSDYYILLIIGYFFVSFAGTIFYFYLLKTFSRKNIFTNKGISIREKYFEVSIRTIIFISYYKISFEASLLFFTILRILEIFINKNYKDSISTFIIISLDLIFIFSMIYFLNVLLKT